MIFFPVFMIARLREVVRAGCELVQPANTPDRPAIPAALRASDFESDRLALAGSIVEFTAPAGTKFYQAVPFDPVSGNKVLTSSTGDPALVAARNVAYLTHIEHSLRPRRKLELALLPALTCAF